MVSSQPYECGPSQSRDDATTADATTVEVAAVEATTVEAAVARTGQTADQENHRGTLDTQSRGASG